MHPRWLKRAKVNTLLLIILINLFFCYHLPMKCTGRNAEMLVLTSLDGGESSSRLPNGGHVREDFGLMKSRRVPEMNLVFKLFQNSVLPICTYLGSPFKLLTPTLASPLTDSEGRHLSFLGAASSQSK